MKRTVGAAVILLAFTTTACSGSEPTRSWSEFESCVYALYPSEDPDHVWTTRLFVENYREGWRWDDDPSREVVECEKVMPILTTDRRGREVDAVDGDESE